MEVAFKPDERDAFSSSEIGRFYSLDRESHVTHAIDDEFSMMEQELTDIQHQIEENRKLANSPKLRTREGARNPALPGGGQENQEISSHFFSNLANHFDLISKKNSICRSNDTGDSKNKERPKEPLENIKENFTSKLSLSTAGKLPSAKALPLRHSNH